MSCRGTDGRSRELGSCETAEGRSEFSSDMAACKLVIETEDVRKGVTSRGGSSQLHRPVYCNECLKKRAQEGDRSSITCSKMAMGSNVNALADRSSSNYTSAVNHV